MAAKQNQLDYIREYNAQHYDRLNLLLPAGTKNEWKEKAKSLGLSITQMLIEAVENFSRKK